MGRTNDQNGYYWGPILGELARCMKCDTKKAHSRMKWKFLPGAFASTAKLSSQEFSIYCERVRDYAKMTYGVEIPAQEPSPEGEDVA